MYVDLNQYVIRDIIYYYYYINSFFKMMKNWFVSHEINTYLK